MNKFAYYRLLGRDLALRTIIDDSVSDITKTAEADRDADEMAVVGAYAESIDFVDELRKIAFNQGALTAFSTVLEALREEGADVEKIANALEAEMAQGQMAASGPAPEGGDEQAALVDEMVSGAIEAISAATGADPNDPEVINAAIELVANELEGGQEEPAAEGMPQAPPQAMAA